MQKHKHIKYTKLSPIMLKTNTFPSGVAILSYSQKILSAASAGDYSFCFVDLVLWSRHLVIH